MSHCFEHLLGPGEAHNLSAVQPSVSHNHELCQEYDFLRQRACVSMHRVPIVEVITPFILRDLWRLMMPFNSGIGGADGVDRFLLLFAQHISMPGDLHSWISPR